ncbi:hypothetical protein FQS60_23260 [Escherichia coli]|nr:hypothetical protein [Escherichia coli]
MFPRHLRAEKARFFVHARILDGSSRHAGRKSKKSFKKIVQICALLCRRAIHDFRLYFSVFRWPFSIPIW